MNQLKCEHYNNGCGGCTIINLNVDDYKKYKKSQLNILLQKLNFSLDNVKYYWLNQCCNEKYSSETSSLEKYLQENDIENLSKIFGRRKVNFKINSQKQLCFSGRRKSSLIAIKQCLVVNEKINQFISPLNLLLKKLNILAITDVDLIIFDNIIAVVIGVDRSPNLYETKIINDFANLNKCNFAFRIAGRYQKSQDIYQVAVPQIYYRQHKIVVANEVFLQASSEASLVMIVIIRNYLKTIYSQRQKIGKKTKIIDLFCGFGNYSFAIFDLASSIEAFDNNEAMIKLLNKNSSNLILPIRAKTVDLFTTKIDKKILDDANLVIINPPRLGAKLQAMAIAESNLQNLIYISCNPQSFVVDAKIIIDSGFILSKVFAIDQFFGSDHFELLAIFAKE